MRHFTRQGDLATANFPHWQIKVSQLLDTRAENGSRYKWKRWNKIYIIQVNEKSCRLRMGAYWDGVKRKRDKIGMGL